MIHRERKNESERHRETEKQKKINKEGVRRSITLFIN